MRIIAVHLWVTFESFYHAWNLEEKLCERIFQYKKTSNIQKVASRLFYVLRNNASTGLWEVCREYSLKIQFDAENSCALVSCIRNFILFRATFLKSVVRPSSLKRFLKTLKLSKLRGRYWKPIHFEEWLIQRTG